LLIVSLIRFLYVFQSILAMLNYYNVKLLHMILDSTAMLNSVICNVKLCHVEFNIAVESSILVFLGVSKVETD
jgi:hypothetical protein